MGTRPATESPEHFRSDPCLLFALRREAMSVRKLARPLRRLAGAPCLAYFADGLATRVLIVETGVGPEAMERALDSLDQLGVPYRPRFVLSAGFSGALRPELHVGDLVLAEEVVDEQGGRWPVPWPAGPVQFSQEVIPRRGRIVTTPILLGDPEQKRRLGEQHDALAVDMETACVARWCQQRQVPFGCLRVISDDWQTPLSPHLVDLLRDGRVSPLRLLVAIVRRPRLIGELWRLAGHTRSAAHRLALGITDLLKWLAMPSGEGRVKP
jgi:adenosylhomocysteine nucleosidase